MNKISLKSVTKLMSCCPERRLAQTKSLCRKNGKHFKAIEWGRDALPSAVFCGESPAGEAAVRFRFVSSYRTPRPGSGRFRIHGIYNLSVWPLFCVLLSKLIAQCLSYSKSHHMWREHNVSLLASPLNYRSFTELCDLCGRCYRHQSQLAFFPPCS